MIVELNIGLPPSTKPDAIIAAGHQLGRMAAEVHSRVQEIGYQGPHGPVQETVLVIRAHLEGTVTDDMLTALAMDYCRLFSQDCIAVCMPDIKIGALIGPKAAEWGGFDINKFVPFVVAEKQQEEKKID